jgi:hypothetical protein
MPASPSQPQRKESTLKPDEPSFFFSPSSRESRLSAGNQRPSAATRTTIAERYVIAAPAGKRKKAKKQTSRACAHPARHLRLRSFFAALILFASFGAFCWKDKRLRFRHAE